MCILGIFIVGFMVALHNLYWYFSPVVILSSFIPTQAEYDAALQSPGVVSFGGFVFCITLLHYLFHVCGAFHKS